MKLSLRSQKISNSVDYSARCNHDERITNSSTVDTTLSHLNVYFKSEHFTPDLEQLWKNIRSDFDNKKAKNLISPKARFLKRKQTKTTKDKNGLKKSEQVDVSITREFLIQIGKEEDDISLERRKELYEKIMKFLAEKYKLTILKADLHADEKTPHLHFIATTYDFETGQFSKEFGKPDSYGEMQNEALAYARTLMPELEDKVDKDCDFHDYIEPQVYRRNKELLDTAQEYCKKKNEFEKELTELKEQLEEPTKELKTIYSNRKKFLDIFPEVKEQKEQGFINKVYSYIKTIKNELFNALEEIKTLKAKLEVYETENDNKELIGDKAHQERMAKIAEQAEAINKSSRFTSSKAESNRDDLSQSTQTDLSSTSDAQIYKSKKQK